MRLFRLEPVCALSCLLVPASLDYAGNDERVTAPPARNAQDGPDLGQVTNQVIRSTNEFRKKEGRREVKKDAKLAATAQYFADYMARTEEYGHDADGSQPADRAKKHGYQYCIIAENIAYEYHSAGFTTEELAKGFFEGWKNSPEHRKNMLDPDVTGTGVAVARSEKSGYYYAVQMFGRPESERIKFKITNRSNSPIRYEIAGEKYSLSPGTLRTHQQCRSTELTLPGSDQDDADQKNASQKINPQNGDQYAVVREESGKIRIVKE